MCYSDCHTHQLFYNLYLIFYKKTVIFVLSPVKTLDIVLFHLNGKYLIAFQYRFISNEGKCSELQKEEISVYSKISLFVSLVINL